MLKSQTALPILKAPDHLVPKEPENYPFHDLDQDQINMVDKVRLQLQESFDNAQVTLTERDKEWLTDRCLVRYLKAAKWDITQSLERLIKTVTWRQEYQPDRIDPDEVAIEAESGKEIISGFDKEGRPLFYLIPKKENTKEYNRQLKYVVFNLEKAITMMPSGVEKITLILDYEGISMFNAPPLSVTRMFLQIIGDHYPERLGMSFVINPSWYLWVFFRVVKPLIDPVTASKINFVDLKNVKPKTDGADLQGVGTFLSILDYIDSDQLLSEYGGSYEMPWDFKSYWKALTQ